MTVDLFHEAMIYPGQRDARPPRMVVLTPRLTVSCQRACAVELGSATFNHATHESSLAPLGESLPGFVARCRHLRHRQG